MPKTNPKINQDEKTQGDKSVISSTVSALKQVFCSEKYFDIYFLKASVDFSYGIISVNVGYILSKQYLLRDQSISLTMIFLSLCCTLTNIVLVKLNKNWKYSDTSTGKKKLLKGAILITICYIGLICDKFCYFFVSLSLMSVAKTFLDSTITEALLFRIADEGKCLLLSTLENVALIFDIACPIVSGFVIEIFGYKMSYVLSSLIMFIGTVLFYFRKLEKMSKSWNFELFTTRVF